MTDGNHSGFIGNKAYWPLAVLRVYSGVFFLIYGYGKLTREGGFADGMSGFLNSRENMFGFYRSFVDAVVLPNAGLFSYLVALGEAFLGIALILGLATRYAAYAGAFLVINFWFAKGGGFFSAMNHDAVWMMILLFLALMKAGQVYGLDGQLKNKYSFLA
jgi:thiosulfate dehydrogenase [quinone] large subunit